MSAGVAFGLGFAAGVLLFLILLRAVRPYARKIMADEIQRRMANK